MEKSRTQDQQAAKTQGKLASFLWFSAPRRKKAAVNTHALHTLREVRRSLAVAKRLDCACL